MPLSFMQENFLVLNYRFLLICYMLLTIVSFVQLFILFHISDANVQGLSDDEIKDLQSLAFDSVHNLMRTEFNDSEIKYSKRKILGKRNRKSS